MTAFIVGAWYCTTRATRAPIWGAAAGVMATLAFFTKAAAADLKAAAARVKAARAVHERAGAEPGLLLASAHAVTPGRHATADSHQTKSAEIAPQEGAEFPAGVFVQGDVGSIVG